MRLAATLVTDGTSDFVLQHPLEWLMRKASSTPVDLTPADASRSTCEVRGLAARLEWAIRNHPCNLLLVHRDAEGQEAQLRYDEILRANRSGVPHVCVVPVRMTEAWLLHNEAALRFAANRPSGTEKLNLPPPGDWERIPDPKGVLHDALRRAHGGKGRRARSFSPAQAAKRMAESVEDWSPLLQLKAFRRLDTDLRDALGKLGATLTPTRA